MILTSMDNEKRIADLEAENKILREQLAAQDEKLTAKDEELAAKDYMINAIRCEQILKEREKMRLLPRNNSCYFNAVLFKIPDPY